MESMQKFISSYMFEFMLECRKALRIITSNNDKKEIQCLAVLTRATYHLSCAKTMFILNRSMYDDEIDTLFHKAEVFLKEITDSISTNHSYQWSNIEYDALVEAYKSSVFNEIHKFKED